jgi:hypothetical protein
MTHACYCVTKHNAPLERMDCPTPEPKGAEVLIRMTAAGVCHSDIHIWEGVYDLGSGNKMTLKDRGVAIEEPDRTPGRGARHQDLSGSGEGGQHRHTGEQFPIPDPQASSIQ